jgi:hypothetical protein
MIYGNLIPSPLAQLQEHRTLVQDAEGTTWEAIPKAVSVEVFGDLHQVARSSPQIWLSGVLDAKWRLASPGAFLDYMEVTSDSKQTSTY